MPLYKLTDANMGTRNATAWTLRIPVRVPTPARRCVPALCSSTVLHAYVSPELAEFLDRHHGHFGPTGLLFEARGRVVVRQGDLKVGCHTLTLTRELPRVRPTPEQSVVFAIACAWHGSSIRWKRWARRWLANVDRRPADYRYRHLPSNRAQRTAEEYTLSRQFLGCTYLAGKTAIAAGPLVPRGYLPKCARWAMTLTPAQVLRKLEARR